jgi:hypothetical protein
MTASAWFIASWTSSQSGAQASVLMSVPLPIHLAEFG